MRPVIVFDPSAQITGGIRLVPLVEALPSKTFVPLPVTGQDVQISNVTMLDGNYQEKEYFNSGEPLVIKIDYIAHNKIEAPAFGIHIYDSNGVCFTSANTHVSQYKIDSIEGQGSIYYAMEFVPFQPGVYRVRIDVWDKNMGMRDKQDEAAYLHVRGVSFTNGIFYTKGFWQQGDNE